MAEGVVDDLEVIEVEKEDGEGALSVAAGALTGVPQPLDEADAIRKSGEAVVERVVAQLALDALRLDGAAPQLDLGNGGFSDLGKVADLVVRPRSWRRVDREHDREGFARCAGDANAEEAGDT